MTDSMKRTFQSLGDAELQFGVSEEELLFADLFKQEELFLGYYSDEGLEIAMEEYGIKEDLRKLGFENTQLRTAPHSNGYQLQILQDDAVLIDVVVDIANLNLGETLRLEAQSATHRVLYVHWLEMRNPHREFDTSAPPLPAQEYPGLGLGHKVYKILENVCRRLELDAIVAVPMYYHNAVFYSKWFRYADPKYQGMFHAVARDSKNLYENQHGFPEHCAISLCSWSFVVEPPIDIVSNKKLQWFTEPIISPLAKSLKKYLHSDWYTQHTKISEELISLEFPESALFQRLEEIGIYPFDPCRFRDPKK